MRKRRPFCVGGVCVGGVCVGGVCVGGVCVAGVWGLGLGFGEFFAISEACQTRFGFREVPKIKAGYS